MSAETLYFLTLHFSQWIINHCVPTNSLSPCVFLFPSTISHAGLARHLPLGSLLQILLPTKRWIWFLWNGECTWAYLGVPCTGDSPLKSILWLFIHIAIVITWYGSFNHFYIRILNFRSWKYASEQNVWVVKCILSNHERGLMLTH